MAVGGGVFVGTGVDVAVGGMGVKVGVGVLVGAGAAVGDGVFVGDGAAVGDGVAVLVGDGVKVGALVGDGAGVDVAVGGTGVDVGVGGIGDAAALVGAMATGMGVAKSSDDRMQPAAIKTAPRTTAAATTKRGAFKTVHSPYGDDSRKRCSTSSGYMSRKPLTSPPATGLSGIMAIIAIFVKILRK